MNFIVAGELFAKMRFLSVQDQFAEPAEEMWERVNEMILYSLS